ncbi:MAG TPA: hypothetical protein VKA84_09885 [Gemmatimonadaceae bacterium]|nr:hypothetical protein [Gemmatimonadaceae bacterium]
MATTGADAAQHEGTTVSGGNILSMLAAMGPFRRTGERILADHGIRDVTAEGWYPLDAYVRSLDTIEAKMGPNTLYQVGKEIPNHIMLPPGLDTFPVVIGSFEPAFAMNHRGWAGVPISHRVTGPKSGVIISATPYPCDFDRGVIQGFFTKLLGARLKVEHDPTKECKKKGGRSCTHIVSEF